jgi:hypothetical protein
MKKTAVLIFAVMMLSGGGGGSSDRNLFSLWKSDITNAPLELTGGQFNFSSYVFSPNLDDEK